MFEELFGLSKTPRDIMLFGGLTFFFLALGSTAIYAYTPDLYPAEIRATGMGIASAWGWAGAVTLLLSFGYFFALKGKSVLFIISDSVLLIASGVSVMVGQVRRQLLQFRVLKLGFP